MIQFKKKKIIIIILNSVQFYEPMQVASFLVEHLFLLD